MAEPRIFVISGPSGVGKNAIISELLKKVPGSGKILNCTSRAKRHGEEALRDYRFLTVEEFIDKFERDEFLEAGQYSGSCYGTLRADLEEAKTKHEILFWILDVKGAKIVKESGGLPGNVSYIFILPQPTSVLTQRLNERNLSEMEKEARIKQAEWEISQAKMYDFLIENNQGELDQAVNRIAEIVNKKN